MQRTELQADPGWAVGQAIGVGATIALSFIPVCGANSIVQLGIRGINAVQGVGNVINAYEAFSQGDMAGGILNSVAALGNAASMLRACFAAGTPIRTPDGHKNIEDLRPGDLVLARHEANPNGLVGSRVVEEVFSTVAPIFHLHVGGRVVRTTGEHPFYVVIKGWIAANALAIGDLLLSHDGQIVSVEDLLDTGEYEPVYNVRVAEYHTYFVGEVEWGWSAWAHNACDLSKIKSISRVDVTTKGLRSAKFGAATVYMLFDKTSKQLLKMLNFYRKSWSKELKDSSILPFT